EVRRRCAAIRLPPRRAPPARPRSPGASWSCLLESRLLVGHGEGVEQCVEVAVEDLVEVVRLEVDPVIGDAVLGEVVGADPLAAVYGADLARAVRRGVGTCLLLGQGLQP